MQIGILLGMVKAIFFDFFGVIMPDLLDEWLLKQGISRDGRIEAASVDANVGRIDKDAFFKILADEVGRDVDQIQSEYEAIATPNQEIVNIISKVNRSYPTLLISNADHVHLTQLIQKFGIDKLFNHIVISGKVGSMKPHHEIYEEALKQAGCKPEEVVFTDDRAANIEGAERAGITNAFVYESPQQLVRELHSRGVEF